MTLNEDLVDVSCLTIPLKICEQSTAIKNQPRHLQLTSLTLFDPPKSESKKLKSVLCFKLHKNVAMLSVDNYNLLRKFSTS